MSTYVHRTETRTARLTESGCRETLTVKQLRAFLADVDELGLPDDTPVRYDTALAGEGGRWSVRLEASTRTALDGAEAAR